MAKYANECRRRPISSSLDKWTFEELLVDTDGKGERERERRRGRRKAFFVLVETVTERDTGNHDNVV